MSGTKGTIITSCTMTSIVRTYDFFRDWGGVGRKNGDEDQIRKLQLSVCIILSVHRCFVLHFFSCLKTGCFFCLT